MILLPAVGPLYRWKRKDFATMPGFFLHFWLPETLKGKSKSSQRPVWRWKWKLVVLHCLLGIPTRFCRTESIGG